MSVHAARDDLHRVRGNAQRRDTRGRVLERLQRISRRGAHVPEHNLRIETTWMSAFDKKRLAERTTRQEAGIVAERNGVELAEMSLQSSYRLSGGYIPEENCAITTAGRKFGIVGGADVSSTAQRASSGDGHPDVQTI